MLGKIIFIINVVASLVNVALGIAFANWSAALGWTLATLWFSVFWIMLWRRRNG